jgi:hypothetical protein
VLLWRPLRLRNERKLSVFFLEKLLILLNERYKCCVIIPNRSLNKLGQLSVCCAPRRSGRVGSACCVNSSARFLRATRALPAWDLFPSEERAQKTRSGTQNLSRGNSRNKSNRPRDFCFELPGELCAGAGTHQESQIVFSPLLLRVIQIYCYSQVSIILIITVNISNHFVYGMCYDYLKCFVYFI